MTSPTPASASVPVPPLGQHLSDHVLEMSHSPQPMASTSRLSWAPATSQVAFAPPLPLTTPQRSILLLGASTPPVSTPIGNVSSSIVSTPVPTSLSKISSGMPTPYSATPAADFLRAIAHRQAMFSSSSSASQRPAHLTHLGAPPTPVSSVSMSSFNPGTNPSLPGTNNAVGLVNGGSLVSVGSGQVSEVFGSGVPLPPAPQISVVSTPTSSSNAAFTQLPATLNPPSTLCEPATLRGSATLNDGSSTAISLNVDSTLDLDLPAATSDNARPTTSAAAKATPARQPSSLPVTPRTPFSHNSCSFVPLSQVSPSTVSRIHLSSGRSVAHLRKDDHLDTPIYVAVPLRPSGHYTTVSGTGLGTSLDHEAAMRLSANEEVDMEVGNDLVPYSRVHVKLPVNRVRVVLPLSRRRRDTLISRGVYDPFRDDDSDEEDRIRKRPRGLPVDCKIRVPFNSFRGRHIHLKEPGALPQRFLMRNGPVVLEPWASVLTEHSLTNRALGYRCGWKGCDSTLASEKLMIRHLERRQHALKGRFVTGLWTQGALYRCHWRGCEGPCFRSAPQLKQHILARHISSGLICPYEYCYFKSPNISHLSRHVMRHHDDPSEQPFPFADLSELVPPPVASDDDMPPLPAIARTEELTTENVRGAAPRNTFRQDFLRAKVQRDCFAPEEPEIHSVHPPHMLDPLQGDDDDLSTPTIVSDRSPSPRRMLSAEPSSHQSLSPHPRPLSPVFNMNGTVDRDDEVEGDDVALGLLQGRKEPRWIVEVVIPVSRRV